MNEPQQFNDEIKWKKLPQCGHLRGKFGDTEYVISKDPNMTPFLSRVYDVKHKFERDNGCAPQYLLLSEAAQNALQEFIEEQDRAGFLRKDFPAEPVREQLCGMLVLRNAHEGMPPLTACL